MTTKELSDFSNLSFQEAENVLESLANQKEINKLITQEKRIQEKSSCQMFLYLYP